MARREYKPYPTRRQQKNRSVRNIALVLIVFAVGVVILIRSYRTKPAAEEAEQTRVSLPDILINKPEAQERTDPVPTSTPAPAAAAEPQSAPRLSGTASPQQPAAAPSAPAAATASPAPATAAPTAAATAPRDDVTGSDARAVIEKAMQLRDEGKIVAARDLFNSALDMPLSPQVRSAVKHQLAQLAENWLFTSEVVADDKLCSYYQVQPGEVLANIAKKFKVPYELLMQINGIQRPELLQAGRRIKVVNGPFNAVVYKGSFTMDLYLQTSYVKTYRVGLGKPEYDTPTGRWQVGRQGKMIKPTWTDPDTGKTFVGTSPDYPLGARWIGLDGLDGAARGRTGFALHGTNEPVTIGTRSSRGCIRLLDSDVIEVYNLLYAGISEVLVKD